MQSTELPVDKLGAFTRVAVKKSIVIEEAPIEFVWRICREWDQKWYPLLPDGSEFTVYVEDGFANAEVGAVRATHLGPTARVYEQLVAIDDQIHVVKWRGVKHPNVVNPFQEASFINFYTTLQCHDVTLGGSTFVEWEGECYTEPQFAASVHQTMEAWYATGVISLKEYVRQQLVKESGLPRPRSRAR